jgi:hypothetical protein
MSAPVRIADDPALELDFDLADADSELLSLDDLLDGDELASSASAARLGAAVPLRPAAPSVSPGARPERRLDRSGTGDASDDLAWLGVQIEEIERELGEIHSAVERLEQSSDAAAAVRSRPATDELLDAIEHRLGRLEGAVEGGSARTRDQIESALSRSHWRLALLGSAALVALGVLLLRG